MQVVVAGKAHPQDAAGKDVMQSIVELARDPRTHGRVVFLENYDIGLARLLIPGCDVWLNNPRRPQEASGTSGMKAAVNGVLNLSVLDGWWAEAYDPDVGWAIDGVSDEADAEQLYRLLEEQVVPTFVDDRGRWLEMMKASIGRLAPRFSMHRARDRVRRALLPAGARGPQALVAAGRSRVDGREREDDQPVEDLPRRLRRVQDRQQRVEHREDERAEDRAGVAADAAEDRRAADDDGGDRRQQERRRRCRGRRRC